MSQKGVNGVKRLLGTRGVAGPMLVALALPLAGMPAVAADVVSVRRWPPGVVEARVGQPQAGIVQTERFDALTAGSQAAFTSAFGGGAISGTYSGDFALAAAGAGNSITSARPQSNYTLTFLHDRSVPGVNFFGLDVVGFEAGNTLTFFRNLTPVAAFTGADLLSLSGPCGAGMSCGDPAIGRKPEETYGYVGFIDQTGLFDQVELAQTTAGALFDTDNHMVAYVTTSAGSVDVPEPSSTALLAVVLFGFATARTTWGTVGTPGPLARSKEGQYRS